MPPSYRYCPRSYPSSTPLVEAITALDVDNVKCLLGMVATEGFTHDPCNSSASASTRLSDAYICVEQHTGGGCIGHHKHPLHVLFEALAKQTDYKCTTEGLALVALLCTHGGASFVNATSFTLEKLGCGNIGDVEERGVGRLTVHGHPVLYYSFHYRIHSIIPLVLMRDYGADSRLGLCTLAPPDDPSSGFPFLAFKSLLIHPYIYLSDGADSNDDDYEDEDAVCMDLEGQHDQPNACGDSDVHPRPWQHSLPRYNRYGAATVYLDLLEYLVRVQGFDVNEELVLRNGARISPFRMHCCEFDMHLSRQRARDDCDIRSSHVNVLCKLIDLGANVNVPSAYGSNLFAAYLSSGPIYFSPPAQEDGLWLVGAFIRGGLEVNTLYSTVHGGRDAEQCCTVLGIACRYAGSMSAYAGHFSDASADQPDEVSSLRGTIGIVHALLKRGADPTIPSTDGCDECPSDLPFHNLLLAMDAAVLGRKRTLSIFKKLFKRNRSDGCDDAVPRRLCPLSLTDYRGWTALHCAMSSGCFDVAKMLMRMGADARVPTGDCGMLPLHLLLALTLGGDDNEGGFAVRAPPNQHRIIAIIRVAIECVLRLEMADGIRCQTAALDPRARAIVAEFLSLEDPVHGTLLAMACSPRNALLTMKGDGRHAAGEGCSLLVKFLIDNGACVRTVPSVVFPQCQFLPAAELPFHNFLGTIVQKRGTRLKASDRSALLAFLDAGVDTQARDSKGRTPLMVVLGDCALSSKIALDVVAAMLLGPSRPPLHEVRGTIHTLVKEMIPHCNAHERGRNTFSLVESDVEIFREILRLLLSCVASSDISAVLNSVDDGGQTPLHIACSRVLSVDRVSSTGTTLPRAVITAATVGFAALCSSNPFVPHFTHMIDTLLAAGADPSILSEVGSSATVRSMTYPLHVLLSTPNFLSCPWHVGTAVRMYELMIGRTPVETPPSSSSSGRGLSQQPSPSTHSITMTPMDVVDHEGRTVLHCAAGAIPVSNDGADQTSAQFLRSFLFGCAAAHSRHLGAPLDSVLCGPNASQWTRLDHSGESPLHCLMRRNVGAAAGVLWGSLGVPTGEWHSSVSSTQFGKYHRINNEGDDGLLTQSAGVLNLCSVVDGRGMNLLHCCLAFDLEDDGPRSFANKRVARTFSEARFAVAMSMLDSCPELALGVDGQGRTPLHLVSMMKIPPQCTLYDRFVECLMQIAASADTEKNEMSSMSSVGGTAEREESKSTTGRLISANYANLRDQFGRSAMHYAAHATAVTYSGLGEGAPRNGTPPPEAMRIIVALAVRYGPMATLVRFGADAALCDNDGFNCLHVFFAKSLTPAEYRSSRFVRTRPREDGWGRARDDVFIEAVAIPVFASLRASDALGATDPKHTISPFLLLCSEFGHRPRVIATLFEMGVFMRLDPKVCLQPDREGQRPFFLLTDGATIFHSLCYFVHHGRMDLGVVDPISGDTVLHAVCRYVKGDSTLRDGQFDAWSIPRRAIPNNSGGVVAGATGRATTDPLTAALEFLFERAKFDASITNNHGRCAFELLCDHNSPQTILAHLPLFISAGYDVNRLVNSLVAPFNRILLNNMTPHLLANFLEMGVDVDLKWDENSVTGACNSAFALLMGSRTSSESGLYPHSPLTYACRQRLLANGADINVRTGGISREEVGRMTDIELMTFQRERLAVRANGPPTDWSRFQCVGPSFRPSDWISSSLARQHLHTLGRRAGFSNVLQLLLDNGADTDDIPFAYHAPPPFSPTHETAGDEGLEGGDISQRQYDRQLENHRRLMAQCSVDSLCVLVGDCGISVADLCLESEQDADLRRYIALRKDAL